MMTALRFDQAAATRQSAALTASDAPQTATVAGELLVTGPARDTAAGILTARGFDLVAEAGSVALWRHPSADVAGTCADLRVLGLVAAPNHVIVAAAVSKGRGAAAPSPVAAAVGKGRGATAPSPTALRPAGPAGSTAGAGVRVAVLDSGPGRPVDGVLPGAAGHGTFVAGIVRQVAPAAAITTIEVLDDTGTGTEFTAAAALFALAAEAEAPQLVNLSFVALGPAGEPVPIGLDAAVRELKDRHPGTIVVAAAGNTASSTPAFPAAFKSVLAVGTPSAYSNHGWWVDCTVAADGIVSDLTTGVRDTGVALVEQHSPWAAWTGTSFAAPQITGILAVLISHGWDSAAALTALSRPATAGR
ncbi:peptidase S8 and S53 subtilisin kexin sedolisin [Actinoplanes friuliensis DSM 7358]|uniref:Peptidase S8 and S53 subtilisin kexin sedolisin n=2 Tax=Actinoplanes friuliensis TaxID=196914 RepID=U5VXT3_9ACTN|nr:peptidase S8 and S53 subtilisin kexin sedolisin [Actinoplanes friuliensis DSM 7358]